MVKEYSLMFRTSIRLTIIIANISITIAKPNKIKYCMPLTEKVEKVYCNDWLLNYGNKWQKVIDASTNGLINQKFHNTDSLLTMLNHCQRRGKDCSLSFRMHYAMNVVGNICRKFRLKNVLKENWSIWYPSLPSYTQLGMAALLPNKNMSFQPTE